jgi:hypothetical protein
MDGRLHEAAGQQRRLGLGGAGAVRQPVRGPVQLGERGGHAVAPSTSATRTTSPTPASRSRSSGMPWTPRPRSFGARYVQLADPSVAALEDLSARLAPAGLLDVAGGFALTAAGRQWLTGPLGVDPDGLRPGRRPLARPCLDWTERRQHLAGVAGARLCDRLFGQGWVIRVGSGRAVRTMPEGRTALRDLLGITGLD